MDLIAFRDQVIALNAARNELEQKLLEQMNHALKTLKAGDQVLIRAKDESYFQPMIVESIAPHEWAKTLVGASVSNGQTYYLYPYSLLSLGRANLFYGVDILPIVPNELDISTYQDMTYLYGTRFEVKA